MRFKQVVGIERALSMSAFSDTSAFAIDVAADVKAMRRLWAAKLLVHAKDYAAGVKIMGGKSVTAPTLTSGATLAHARKAYAWMCSPDDQPATFVWICGLFDLDPDRTRMRIFHKWREFLVAGGKEPKVLIEEDDDE